MGESAPTVPSQPRSPRGLRSFATRLLEGQETTSPRVEHALDHIRYMVQYTYRTGIRTNAVSSRLLPSWSRQLQPPELTKSNSDSKPRAASNGPKSSSRASVSTSLTLSAGIDIPRRDSYEKWSSYPWSETYKMTLTLHQLNRSHGRTLPCLHTPCTKARDRRPPHSDPQDTDSLP